MLQGKGKPVYILNIYNNNCLMIRKIDKITTAKERKKEETRSTFSLDRRVGAQDAAPPGCRAASIIGTLRHLYCRVTAPPPLLGRRSASAGTPRHLDMQ
jgi:hypothetical protein